MNLLMIFKTLRNLSALIEQANLLAGPDKRWPSPTARSSWPAWPSSPRPL